jgi:hypothetical protein
MAAEQDANAVYSLGSSQGESARLMRQADELAADSRVLLDRVGLRPGQTAIDPPHPAFDRIREIFLETFRRNGADPHIGRKLPEMFRAAGLTEGGVEALAAVYSAGHTRRMIVPNLVASMRPHVLEMGLASESEAGPARLGGPGAPRRPAHPHHVRHSVPGLGPQARLTGPAAALRAMRVSHSSRCRFARFPSYPACMVGLSGLTGRRRRAVPLHTGRYWSRHDGIPHCRRGRGARSAAGARGMH